ncbi:MAG: hypothetical protein HY710_00610, partial [Candidatus Latescibacteria bacterium]|nr:hypothetical protein [Candidatus Latescibacterota bacterium]
MSRTSARMVDAHELSIRLGQQHVHSVGVIEFKPPIFGPSSQARLKPDMIISVDIPLFNAPWDGLCIEDGYLITKTKAERLHTT